jgi:hypothetical protein
MSRHGSLPVWRPDPSSRSRRNWLRLPVRRIDVRSTHPLFQACCWASARVALVRNMGLGEQAAKRSRHAQVHQATLAKLRIMDQVAQEVAEAHVQTIFRRKQIEVAKEAILRAQQSYERNMERIGDAEGLPIEVLQSIQALEQAQRCYLDAVGSYNRAQLQLAWATGWPIDGSTTSISESASSPVPEETIQKAQVMPESQGSVR